MLQVIFSRAKGKYLEIPLACMFSRDAIFTSYSQLRSKMGDSESESELEPAPNFTNLEPESESVLGLPIANTYPPGKTRGIHVKTRGDLAEFTWFVRGVQQVDILGKPIY